MTDPAGMAAVDAQQSQQPPPPQGQGTRPTLVITPEQINLEFYSFPNDKPDDPSARVPASPEANRLMNVAAAQMVSNILNAMVTVDSIEQTSGSSSTSISLQGGLRGVSGSVSVSVVPVQNADQARQETYRANSVIQGELTQTLSQMVSPVSGNSQGAQLGSVPAVNASSVAASFAQTVRRVANDKAREIYPKLYNKPYPSSFETSVCSGPGGLCVATKSGNH